MSPMRSTVLAVFLCRRPAAAPRIRFCAGGQEALVECGVEPDRFGGRLVGHRRQGDSVRGVQPVEVPGHSSRPLGDHVEVHAQNEDADAWRGLTAVERGCVNGEGGPGQRGEEFHQKRDVPAPVAAEREQCTAQRLPSMSRTEACTRRHGIRYARAQLRPCAARRYQAKPAWLGTPCRRHTDRPTSGPFRRARP
jgi:hypothetical protein